MNTYKPGTYKVVGIVDEIPVSKGVRHNPELQAVRAMAKANPGKYIEFATNSPSPTSLTNKEYTFIVRGDRCFVIYTGSSNGAV